MPLPHFHEATRAWFTRAFGEPTPPQREAWPAIARGEHTLIAAPTGSGKTLAAFLAAIDALLREGLSGALGEGMRVLYVSPLKALTNDVERNLEAPLRGIGEELAARGLPAVPIRTAVRTGDTTAADRDKARRRPPSVYVTTPESLYLLLTSKGGRAMLRTVETVIVDEIHALIGDKRGAHLALSLERLDALAARPVQRIGLSATQRPIDEVARFLVGAKNLGEGGAPRCTIVDTGHRRAMDLEIVTPRSPLEPVMALEVWEEVYDAIAELARGHRTTLIFVKSRRLAERVAHHLARRLGGDAVTAHHGSLSRAHRHDAELRLKRGELQALVATASLELGIDIGDVELVCQLGAPSSIATLLQRVGRAGHQVGGVPKGRLFPTDLDELCEHVALLRAVEAGELDRLRMPLAPLDILAQQIVATVAMEEAIAEADLFALCRRAYPYASLTAERFEAVLTMLEEGFTTHHGQRGAYLHRDRVHGLIRPRRGARLTALTSGGAIPDNFDYEVRLEPAGIRVGSVNEDFAIESSAGDIFQLGNASYRILRVEGGLVRVEAAPGMPPSIPFWLGEAPSRTDELSAAISALREDAARTLAAGGDLLALVRAIPGLPLAGAVELARYLEASYRALQGLPTTTSIVAERFFDEVGSQHIVLHCPLGSRVNRAFGLALRKRFCRSFNVELQAAANEEALVLSLGPTHSLPLAAIFEFLRSKTVEDILIQALLDAPLFAIRFRWNASRSLAIPRQRGGKRVAPRFQRMAADDLLAVCFPDQVACLENIAGDRQIPDHPLVEETLRDCLHEAMDIERLKLLLMAIEAGEVQTRAVDTTEPSPLAMGVLSAKPYAFLDDAPLEERRVQAVMSRRSLDPALAATLGALDPAAIERVRRESAPEARDAEELHDALLLHRCLRVEPNVEELLPFFEALKGQGRAFLWRTAGGDFLVATERASELRLVHEGEARPAPPEVRSPGNATDREGALRNLVRGRLDATGPATAHELAAYLALSPEDVRIGLGALESEGVALRGRYRPGAIEDEYCERRLLARIHRYTLGRLRQEIEPVGVVDLFRFLTRFQHLAPGSRLEGVEGLLAVLGRLEGFEAGAAAFETDLLAGRMKDYDPSYLDMLCLGGRAAWGRLSPGAGRASLIKATPIALYTRSALPSLRLPAAEAADLGPEAARLHALLRDRGASFSDELKARAGLVGAKMEDGLAELVAAGLVCSDGFAGLRWLLGRGRQRSARPRRPGKELLYSEHAAGRWALLPEASERSTDRAEAWAMTLLRRYGVVFRRLLDRERGLPPFRELLEVYRRLEAQGTIRGGRFVAGMTGEQYALPEAIEGLRAARRDPRDGELIAISGADPLNLIGIVSPGPKLKATPQSRLLLRDGEPIACVEAGAFRSLVDGTTPEHERLLRGRKVLPSVRAYLGSGV